MPPTQFSARSKFGMRCSILSLAVAAALNAAEPTTRSSPPVQPAADSPKLVDIRLPPRGRPATQPTTQPTTQPSGKPISLNFKDAPLDVVLDHLSDAAGLIVVKEGVVDGRVTVQSAEPVTPEEAVTLLNTVLKANGFTAMQDGRVIHIAPRDKMKKGAVPVHVGNDPSQIAHTDELITQVIPIKNMDAAKLKQDLAPLIGTDADVTANESSNSIIMTDSSANIRRIVLVISSLDQDQTTGTDMAVLHLKFADAKETATLINSVFHGDAAGGGAAMSPQQQMMMQQQGGNPNGQPPGGGGARDGRIPGGAIDQALHGGHVHAEADPRTNTLILTAPSAPLKIIVELIEKELDSNPMPASQLKAFPLKFAQAEPTAKLLNNLFKPTDDNSTRMMYYFGGMPGGGDQSKIKVQITFDERTNAVIVQGPAEAIKAIGSLIDDLDASPGNGAEFRMFPLKYANAYDIGDDQVDLRSAEQGSGQSIPLLFLRRHSAGQQQGDEGHCHVR